MKKFISTTLALAAIATGLYAKDIKGSVKDSEGKGISGVVVSDGLNTVLTDDKGRFTIDTDEDSRFIFISTPSGYRSSVEDGEFSYYKRLDGKRRCYDFKVSANNDINHNVIVIADPQIVDAEELPELEVHSKDIGEYVRNNTEDYTFGICLGDIVGHDHSLYPQYKQTMSHSGIEFRSVMGNHDMTNYGPLHETSLKNYQDAFGPAWYSFNVGKIHYVVLDDNFYIGRDWYYIGYIDERQMNWLKNDLSHVAEGSTVIVSMHIPTTLSEADRKTFKYAEISTVLCNKKALYQVLEPYRSIILSGHTHTQTNQVITPTLMEQNVAGLCGAWWCGPICIDGSPIGYKIMSIKGEEISWQYKASGKPLDYQIKMYYDDRQIPGHVMANIWDYDPEWKVEYFEDGVKVCDMENCSALDPEARECYKNPESLKRLWVYPSVSHNFFKAKFSAEAKELEVRATDRFGRTFTKTITR